MADKKDRGGTNEVAILGILDLIEQAVVDPPMWFVCHLCGCLVCETDGSCPQCQYNLLGAS